MVTILIDNEGKALNDVPGEVPLIHGGLAEDKDHDDDRLEIRDHICLHMLCTCVHNFYHIGGR